GSQANSPVRCSGAQSLRCSGAQVLRCSAELLGGRGVAPRHLLERLGGGVPLGVPAGGGGVQRVQDGVVGLLLLVVAVERQRGLLAPPRVLVGEAPGGDAGTPGDGEARLG